MSQMTDEQKAEFMIRTICDAATSVQIDYANFGYVLSTVLAGHAKSHAKEGEEIPLLATYYLQSSAVLGATPDQMARHAANEAKKTGRKTAN